MLHIRAQVDKSVSLRVMVHPPLAMVQALSAQIAVSSTQLVGSTNVGAGVGSEVGIGVGTVVGEAVGADVGDAVGE